MQRQKGFTLIELLVVVSIIALLIAILLPSMSRAREQARLAACASRMHQLGLALTMYAEDNEGLSPATFEISDSRGVAAYVHYPQRVNSAWPSWQSLGLLYEPTGAYRVAPTNPRGYKLGGGYVDGVRELAYCPAAGRFPIDDPVQGWPENPALIGWAPHTGSVLVNHHLRQPASIRDRYAATKLQELQLNQMAWVFDELVKLGSPDEVPHNGKGINVMYADAHVRWFNLSGSGDIFDYPIAYMGRVEVDAWLRDNVDGH